MAAVPKTMQNNQNQRWWQKFLQWNPIPLKRPEVNPNLETLDPLQRSSESIRYSILSVEWWISKDGTFREWLRQNTRLAAWLAIPAFLVIPIVTFVLWQIVVWLGMLLSISGYLVTVPILGLLAFIVGLVVFHAIKIVLNK